MYFCIFVVPPSPAAAADHTSTQQTTLYPDIRQQTADSHHKDHMSSSASSSWGALGPALSTQPGDVEGRAALLALVTVVTPGTAHSKTLVKCNFCDMTFSAITSRLAAYSSQKNILSAGVHFCEKLGNFCLARATRSALKYFFCGCTFL